MVNAFYQTEQITEISSIELISLLKAKKASSFVSFQMFSVEHNSKTIQKQKALQKRSLKVGQINSDYYTKIDRRLDKEGKDSVLNENKNKANYTLLPNSKCLGYYNNDNNYCIVMQTEGKAQQKNIHYDTFTNLEVSKDKIFDYFTASGIKKYTSEKPTSNAHNLETENLFFHFATKLVNVEFIKIDKQVYRHIVNTKDLIHDTEANKEIA